LNVHRTTPDASIVEWRQQCTDRFDEGRYRQDLERLVGCLTNLMPAGMWKRIRWVSAPAAESVDAHLN
jgi:hypothetical protein